MSEPARELLTAQSLIELGDVAAEIIGGSLVYKAEPSAEHADAQLGLGSFLRQHFHRSGGGSGGWWILTEVDVELARHEVFRPDIAGWRRLRLPERPTGRPIATRPDFVCEVLSPSNASPIL